MDREPVLRAGLIGGDVQQFGIVALATENAHRTHGRTLDNFELQPGGDAECLMDHHDETPLLAKSPLWRVILAGSI